MYSASAARLASITGVISVAFASNQSCDFVVFLPKVVSAVLCMVSHSISHFLVADEDSTKGLDKYKIIDDFSLKS